MSLDIKKYRNKLYPHPPGGEKINPKVPVDVNKGTHRLEQACVLVGKPNLPVYANRGTHKHVGRNRSLCAPVGLQREPRHAIKHTCMFVPCWNTHRVWACNKHTFFFPIGIHRELGHANKHTFVFFQFVCQTFVCPISYQLDRSNHNHLTW